MPVIIETEDENERLLAMGEVAPHKMLRFLMEQPEPGAKLKASF
jgi:hypothetical protein